MRQPHHVETLAPDRRLRLCRAAGVEPALGLAMALAPLNRGVLLLVGETAAGRVCWVERAGLALDVRGGETIVHEDCAAFRAALGLRAAPTALDRYAVRGLWIEGDEDPGRVAAAFERLLRAGGKLDGRRD